MDVECGHRESRRAGKALRPAGRHTVAGAVKAAVEAHRAEVRKPRLGGLDHRRGMIRVAAFPHDLVAEDEYVPVLQDADRSPELRRTSRLVCPNRRHQRIRIERGRWLWISWGADSCGKPAACVPPPLRFISVPGPPPPVGGRIPGKPACRRGSAGPPPGLAAAERGQAPQDGSDRNRLGSSDPWASVVGPPSLQPPGS